MSRQALDPRKLLINEMVEHFVENRDRFKLLLEQLQGIIASDKELAKYIHSSKWRVKDPTSLRNKLNRKLEQCDKERRQFDYTKENLFWRINDLAGFRILHLHTRQMANIDRALRYRLDQELYTLLEEPAARTWDDETRDYFGQIGIQTKDSKTLYTSVHYVIEPKGRARYTCEIQVRTLAEELWGEVNHAINYPRESKSISCREQIAVLARVTSSCSRLVDSIFRSHQDHEQALRRIRVRRRKS